MSTYYPRTLKQWKVQKRVSADDAESRSKTKVNLPITRSLAIHSLDEPQLKSNQCIQQQRRFTFSNSSLIKKRSQKPTQIFRKIQRHSSCERGQSEDRCVSQFQKLISDQQTKIASNLNMIVRNFLKSNNTKKRQVKKLRKETIKQNESNNILSGVLQIFTPRNSKQNYRNTLKNSTLWRDDVFSPYHNKPTADLHVNDQVIEEQKIYLEQNQTVPFISIHQMNLQSRVTRDGSGFNRSHSLQKQKIRKQKLPQKKRKKLYSNFKRIGSTNLISLTPWEVNEV